MNLIANVAALGFALVVGACSLPDSGVLGRQLSWFDYVAGEDMRQSCPRSDLERYRLVFNAEYTKQVRTYDVLQRGEGAILRGHVFRGSLTADRAFPSAIGGFVGETGSLELNPAEFQALRSAVAAAPAPGNDVLYLRADSYFWVVVSCVNGVLSANAFTGPAERLESLPFRRFLLAHDPTGVPVRVQRGVAADRLTGYGSVYSPIETESADRASGRGGAVFQFKYENGAITTLGG
ncbi:MAG: hypothetical protein RID42_17670 [Alphaproteobacteria bacterium]